MNQLIAPAISGFKIKYYGQSKKEQRIHHQIF